MITYICIKIVRRSNKIKKARFAITNVSIKDIYKIIKKSEDLPYEGYVSKSHKKLTTDNYLYISRQLTKCMKRFNMRVGPARTKMTSTQNMNDYEMSTQNITN